MNLDTKLIIAFAILLLIGAMAYLFSTGTQLQGRFNMTPQTEQSSTQK